MAPRYLKKGTLATEFSSTAQTNVSHIVKGVIDDIRENGDAAVRKYSEKFDNWSRESYKLSKTEIDAAIAAVSKQTIDDIKQVQSNVRAFAQAQRDSIRDFEMETQPVGKKAYYFYKGSCSQITGRFPRPEECPNLCCRSVCPEYTRSLVLNSV